MPGYDPYWDSEEGLRLLARTDIGSLATMWNAATIEEALAVVDSFIACGENAAAKDVLGDILRAAVQEVFDRAIALGAGPGECVAETSEIARACAVEVFGWQPKRTTIAPRVRTLVYRRDGYACVECGQDDVRKLTLDHRTPVHLGGGNEPGNLLTRCRSCNSSKGVALR